MQNKDYSMILLAGLPIEIEGIGEISPLKLREIAEIGESVFNQYLSVLCMEIDQLNIEEEQKKQLKDQNISAFLFVLSQCVYDNTGNFLNLILKSLKFFLKQEVIFSPEIQGFWIGGREELERYLIEKKEENNENVKGKILNNENYEEFKKIVKIQNGLESMAESTANPADLRTQQILEKMKESRKKLAKDKGNSDIGLIDLISSFICYNKSFNSEDVWNLTLFQFNNYFKRLQMIMDYEINIQSLLHGADSKKIELQHFISKIEE